MNAPRSTFSSMPKAPTRSEEAPPESVADAGTWTASRALHKFSQLTFSYGMSAAFASLSALVMSIPGGDPRWMIVAAITPFVVSLVISAYVFTDLLEFLWDGVAGRVAAQEAPSRNLWSTTLVLLLVGMACLAAGILLTATSIVLSTDYGYLAPAGLAFLAISGVCILMGIVLPSLVLGPPTGRWMAFAAAALGSVSIAAEAFVAFVAPAGSNPFLGWMEGTFPLLNWNVGFGALTAASAFLLWQSYRFVLPPADGTAVPA